MAITLDESEKAILSRALEFARGGDSETTRQVCRTLIETRPETASFGFRLIGLAEHTAGCHEAAYDAFRQALVLQPELASTWTNLARCADSEEQRDLAMSCLRRCLCINPAGVENTLTLSRAEMRLGDQNAAIQTLERTMGHVDDQRIARALIEAYLAGRRQRDAFNLADQTARQHALCHDLWQKQALLARDMGDSDIAERAVKRSAVLMPSEAHCWTLLASLHERRGDLSKMEALVQRAAAVEPSDFAVACLKTRLETERGDTAKAARFAERSYERHASNPRSYELLFLAAHAHEAAQAYPDAYRTFAWANRSQRAAMPRSVNPERAFRQVSSMRDALSAFQPPSVDLDIDGPDLVFLVGFPRSGTTLLDQVLDGHPQVVVLEEGPLVAGMQARLARRGYGTPASFARIDEASRREARTGYLEDRDCLVDVPVNAVFVDKMPLNMLNAPLIQNIFPRAKFILCLRHPVDVCFSCFKQSFALTDFMAVFTSLDDTAALFQDVFSFWFEARERLKFSVHEVRYEELVTDMEGTVAPLMRFLGLEWDARMGAFDRHARSRAVLTTPSYRQVTRPLYRDAISRWTHYDFAVNSIAKRLEPEIRALGYADK